jgi:hypothetical protein
MLTPTYGHSGHALHLILGWIFFQGTFVILGNFFFPERVAIVGIGIAIALCWRKTARISDTTLPAAEHDHGPTPLAGRVIGT